MNRVKVAMIGVGNISGIYLKNITQTFRELELVGVCDLVRERAEKAAGRVRHSQNLRHDARRLCRPGGADRAEPDPAL